MTFLKKLLVTISVLIVLALIQRLLTYAFPASQFYHRPLISALQFYILEAFILYALVNWVLTKPRKNQVRRKYLGLTVVAVVLFTQEAVFSYWLNHPQKLPEGLRLTYRRYYNLVDMDEIQFDTAFSEYDKDYFYRFKPGKKFQFKNREYNTAYSINNISFRDDNDAVKKPEIVCIGDSYTLGWGVSQDEDFPARLKQQLKKNVLNAGMVSFGTAREFNRLNELDLSDTKYVIWQYCTNDYDENKAFINNNFHLQIRPLERYNQSVIYRENARKYFPGKHFFSIIKLWIGDKLSKRLSGRAFVDLPGVNEEQIADQAKCFLDIVSRSKVDFKKTKVIVLHLDEISFSAAFYNAVNTLLQNDVYKNRFLGNLQIVDLSNKLSRNDFYILDTHLNPVGYQKVADELVKIVR
jgi:lysophospholipase L1-like esterase